MIISTLTADVRKRLLDLLVDARSAGRKHCNAVVEMNGDFGFESSSSKGIKGSVKNISDDPVPTGKSLFRHFLIANYFGDSNLCNKKLHHALPAFIPLKRSLKYFNQVSTVIILLLVTMLYAQRSISQTVQTITASGTFNVPAGVTSIVVNTWGAGGGGGGGSRNCNNDGNGGGGGGGGFAQKTLVVSAGQSYTISIGAGGTAGTSGGGNGGTGGTTNFTGTGGTVTAAGGTGGTGANACAATNTGGTGGAGTSGTILLTGGTGSQGDGGNATSIIGTGGGGAGSGSNGGSPTNNTCPGTGGSGGTGTYPGGGGGYNSSCAVTDVSATGVAGTLPGGGGSGAGSYATAFPGGTGGGGQVVIAYYLLTGTAVSSPICSGTTALVNITASSINLPTGSYTVTYNLSGANTATGNTASMTVSTAGQGTFTTSTLTNSGTTTVTVTQLASSTVTGGIGASNTANITVSLPIASVSSQNNPTCFGGNNGTITISASGGAGPYSYSVNNGTSYTASGTNPYPFPGLQANQAYQIRVKDTNGCISKPVQ